MYFKTVNSFDLITILKGYFGLYVDKYHSKMFHNVEIQ